MTNIVYCKKKVNTDGSVSFKLPEGYYADNLDEFVRSEKYKNLKREDPDLKVYDWSKSYLTYEIDAQENKPDLKFVLKSLDFNSYEDFFFCFKQIIMLLRKYKINYNYDPHFVTILCMEEEEEPGDDDSVEEDHMTFEIEYERNEKYISGDFNMVTEMITNIYERLNNL